MKKKNITLVFVATVFSIIVVGMIIGKSLLKYKEGDYPVAEWLCEHSVCLPVFPELTEEEQDYVIESIVKYFEVN